MRVTLSTTTKPISPYTYEVLIVVIMKITTFWDTSVFRINKLSYLMACTYLNFRLGLINFYADSSELRKICHTKVIVYQI